MNLRRTSATVAFAAVLAVAAYAIFGHSNEPSEQTLRTAVADADRLIIRAGPLGKTEWTDADVLSESGDRAEIRSLLDSIDIEQIGPAGRCRCGGNPIFEFYQGENHLASVGYHDWRLRWEHWENDGELTKRSAEALAKFLREKGITGAHTN